MIDFFHGEAPRTNEIANGVFPQSSLGEGLALQVYM